MRQDRPKDDARLRRQASGKTRPTDTATSTQATFRFHARALAALGRDLVTNDVVAVMELVKNAYDALATRATVHIHCETDDPDRSFMEIDDDGHGMDESTILDVWCVIATPFRKDNPLTRAGRQSRRVTGEKGLGRLAAARLGRTLTIVTRKKGKAPLVFSLNWDEILKADDISESSFQVVRIPSDAFDRECGTRIRIGGLRSTWSSEKIDDLQENLARLVSPFSKASGFSISLDVTGDTKQPTVKVEAPAFMSKPKYAIKGSVDENGTIRAVYRYQPIALTETRERRLREDWEAVFDSLSAADRVGLERTRPQCGPFRFEVRAWDLTQDDTRDIADHFGETRQRIRGAIRSQRGVSVYRDDVLVLPKSEGSRDWLGLDLRRVSRVGRRLSTSQVIGHVSLTKTQNPLLVDTSDREGLVSNPALIAFRTLVIRAITLLEQDRHVDRMEDKDRGPIKDLFADLSAARLVERLEGLRDKGGDLGDAVSAAKAFEHDLEKSRADIARRFGYYNRLAVIGTIAQLVIHEIRNRTTVVGRALTKAGNLAARARDASVRRSVGFARQAIVSLEALAERFAPLASRGYKAGKRVTVVEESIARCLEMQQREIRSQSIAVEQPSGATAVQIDPGELDAIVLNLLTNSVYWLRYQEGDRRLRFRVSRRPMSTRVAISLDDSGPGIRPEDRERVFWPGVTHKPQGVGMGLTVASELVDGHGGRMATLVPGVLGGATFEFDLPLAEPKRDGASAQKNSS